MKTLVSIAALTLTAVAVPAQADTGPTVTIELGDLDLSTAAGQLHLGNRIDSAISRACSAGAHLAPGSAARACRADLNQKIRASIALRNPADRFAALPANPGA